VESISRLSGLSVFLPAHNEEGNIERVVRGFCAEVQTIADDYEVIIVDDGSRDGTGAIADRMSRTDPHIKVVHHQVNRGYGGAVISGISASTQPYVVLCDGDGQFNPAELKRLTAQLEDYDVIVGRRLRRADHFIRRINGKAWTLLIRLLFGIRISDMDCGFKLFRRRFLENLELRARGAMITTDLMVRLAARGARICEVNVSHLPRLAGEQSGNSLKVVLRAFKELFFLYHDLKSTRPAQASGPDEWEEPPVGISGERAHK
jgi:glycosyltransferase involved in cell wall biosynthesis